MGKEPLKGNCSWDNGIIYFTLLPTQDNPDELGNPDNNGEPPPPCTNHTFVSKLTKTATVSADGAITNTCSKCGFTQTSAIAKISDVRLTKTSLDYNGKNQKLALTVRDRADRQLQAGTDYDCLLNGKKTAAIAAKNVGKYTVKIVFKGNYTTSKDLFFTQGRVEETKNTGNQI